jgi:hypothetical protein
MDQAKFDALVHYVCAKCDDPSALGATKLNKVLWYADVLAYLGTGKSITGATYVKRQFGPVPKDIMAARARLTAAGAIVERSALVGAYEQKQMVALARPDVSLFTAEEISVVDDVIDHVCRRHTARSISNLTHDHIWEAAAIGEVIPLSAMHASFIGEVDEDDVAWAKKEMDRIERLAA